MKITATHDSHHVYQDAAFTNLGNYKRNQAVAIGLQGRVKELLGHHIIMQILFKEKLREEEQLDQKP
ncbi:hypothetical protein HMPREF1324_1975 [Rothia aeria F0474]|uniref:Uncharacterized protein n=1 Tax=Rothia aeria F0474 TaxID=1125724 RepID=I0UV26_9MICC|nr:hypothetical protein [Rothia aeria]EID51729.1 hypothetical protein HMPREF1324_1975 [Rothia aeria F0474]